MSYQSFIPYGAEVKQGKHLAFKIPSGKKFVRCSSLGEDYSEAAIMEHIDRKRVIEKAAAPAKPNLLIDIQAKTQQAHSPGFERWAKVFNLKEMAKTVLYLQENGLTDFEEVVQACDEASAKYHDFSDQTRDNSERMKAISELQKHIGAYAKTREIYAQYRKLPPKKQVQFYDEHTSDIIICQAAKRHFDRLGLKKLPTIQSLEQEYATLPSENKRLYPLSQITADAGGGLKNGSGADGFTGVWGRSVTNKHVSVYTETLLATMVTIEREAIPIASN